MAKLEKILQEEDKKTSKITDSLTIYILKNRNDVPSREDIVNYYY